MTTPADTALARRLGTGDAVVVGLSAMLGAGVFVAFTPAAEAAGRGLLVGLGIAAVIAFCNAVASAQLDPRHQVPDRAQVVIGAAVVVLVLAVDLRGAIGFSSFGVLVYYAVANLSALRQPVEQRRWPRALQVLGLVGCLVLAAALPIGSVVAGLAVLAVGVLGRLVAVMRRRTPG